MYREVKKRKKTNWITINNGYKGKEENGVETINEIHLLDFGRPSNNELVPSLLPDK